MEDRPETAPVLAKKPSFRFGPYVPLHRSDDKVIVDPNGVVDYYSENDKLCKKLLGEILPEDSIVDAPSMVLPLLLKKKTVWPDRVAVQEDDSLGKTIDQQTSQRSQNGVSVVTEKDNDDDDVQLIKVINRSQHLDLTKSTARQKIPEEYLRDAIVQKLSASTAQCLAIPSYSESTVNDLLIGIGLSRVQEHVLEDRFRKISSKIRRGAQNLFKEADTARAELQEKRRVNRPYKVEKRYRCSHCSFKSDSMAVLEHHLENPHKMNSRTYICNWCSFKSKDSNQITFHTYVAHKRLSHVEKSLAIHNCRFCTFECNSKVKYTNHIKKCELTFDSNVVQLSEDHHPFAAVTPKLITRTDIRAYESVLKDLRLASYNPHQIAVNSHNGQNILLVASSTVDLLLKKGSVSVSQLSSPFTSNPKNFSPSVTSSSTNYPNQLGQICRTLMATGSKSNGISNVMRNTLLKHPKPHSMFSNGVFTVKNVENIVMGPQVANLTPKSNHCGAGPQVTLSSNEEAESIIDLGSENPVSNKKSGDSFVICEICDAYIESFMDFKTHMQGIHHVKIQKGVSSSKPPLNCQRCQWRFFTDQGLERHLLGAHGLITPGMQDKAEKEIDSGRCTICGRRFMNRLVAHTKDAHKVNLRPAQLTYKCKVCSATYGLYSHFEKHVYQIHPDLQT